MSRVGVLVMYDARVLRVVLIVATVSAVGCPTPEVPRSTDDTELRVRVARAEVKRAGGVAELRELAKSSDRHARELALRALGRIGGPDALAELDAALADRDPEIVASALAAIGVAASLDDDASAPPDPARGERLAAAIRACGDPCAIAGVEALGRAGGSDQEAMLASELEQPRVAATAALALGRYGRRKLALTDDAEHALVHAASNSDRELRYAAVYAISRMVVGDEHPPTTAALVSVIGDPDPEIRATAIAGIAHRKQVAAAHEAIELGLADPDWRVEVEAVRALAGESGDDAGRALVAAQLGAMIGRAADHDGAATQVPIEALRVLLAHPPHDPAPLGALVDAIAQGTLAPELAKLSPRSRGWLSALAIAAYERVANDGRYEVASVAPADLPVPLALGLAAELAVHQGPAAQRNLLSTLLRHPDPRVRAAALPLLVSTVKEAEVADRRSIVATFAAAIASPDPVIAGTAADSVGDLYDAIGNAPERSFLDAAITARAVRERDPELASSLVELIGKHTIAGGLAACRAGLAGHPVLARAAAACLAALGEHADVPAIGIESAPPGIDVATVIGKRVMWHLATSRGEIVIELLPDVAPWNVATIAALTERHFYDGIEFHRVVPDFVVQGGDPTMSGEGGPDFTTPAEPATVLDGLGFVTGGIGMADAGRDSAGSQWFAMHSRAPHLDGRYTWVGQVVTGQNVVDALLIGDRVDHATIELLRK
ncbi:MAG TPA: peptidylprolyl isomerase [Kofleriaceae bacterium]|jgi:cyclophilin family peptidyl-prolyl cis-trans isomerase